LHGKYLSKFGPLSRDTRA